jgi:nitroimidazol reductase NimA-like FMN-containing flavoprotein (pyridoxamine 5'-phosphate oxidase superfamily)
MQREMRRKNQQLSQQESQNILAQATSGVLALSGTDDTPYALPISFVHHADSLYFHCAADGYKIDCIRKNPRASFCVIAQDQLLPEKFTTCFRSVIAFGRMEMVENPQEKQKALHLLCDKYAAGQPGREEEIESAFSRICILALRIDAMTGKEAIELTRARKSSAE